VTPDQSVGRVENRPTFYRLRHLVNLVFLILGAGTLLEALGDAAHPMTPNFVLATRHPPTSPFSAFTGHPPQAAQAVSRW